MGQYCVPSSLDGGQCAPICDPDAGNSCPSGAYCGVMFDGIPSFGACVTCQPRFAPCQQNSDCCSNDCEPGCAYDYSQAGWGANCMECR
ncbi:MAG: hypothetical protein ACYDCL_00930 [Myxococcales bacterium]